MELPRPSEDALAHSARLTDIIHQAIALEQGAITFARFMELALYAPGLGYYSAGARKFGAEGDFVTAPELGGGFAHALAHAGAGILAQLDGDGIWFEIGAGTGALAAKTLKRLQQLGRLPSEYWILEPSADLRERQREHLKETLTPELFARCQWLDAPPEQPWQGVLVANEVIDALPTTRFIKEEGEIYEECVALDARQQFTRVMRPADALVSGAVRHLERYLQREFDDGYCSEVLPQLPYWIQAVAGTLRRGGMLFIDYGYPRPEFYLPERDDGTLICHYRHRAHGDYFVWPGLQDLTASVDFTALAEAGTGAGFRLAGYCSQANFLLANGLADYIADYESGSDEIARYRESQMIKKLILPGEMGERFQFMGFARDVDFSAAFTQGDLSYRL
ncbi:SAM-dependent methyltransferase [Arenimonas sp. GDDSR-1]|uniref:class I SAM-dependent methyltransferase n=1 Tax=Arenimonas sp. GDDSR-1 TaxID=2950125 RepID=UPI0026157FD6|nr:SAM-dependent methyltransferase [Arenimonas sp. GDDSR-1]